MKKIAALALLAGFILSIAGCRHGDRQPFAESEFQPVGKEYYTAVNIWYEHPMEIHSTNYHAGTILPAGTPLEVLEMTNDQVRFKDLSTGAEYRLIHVKRHSTLTMEEYFDRHFADSNPMEDDGKFGSFTNKEQANIKDGKIAKGMSKEAVLMAYGYPPSHETPRLQDSRWRYWIDRWDELEVRFENDRVSRIID